MNDHLRNLALQDIDLRLQRMGKKGLEDWKQMPKPDFEGSAMSQLEEAERSFAKEALVLGF